VYCERCPALAEPFAVDRSSCVCTLPAVMNASGACVCPAGYYAQGAGCVPCGANTYGGLVGSCVACGAGTFSAGGGATACQACPAGQYRLAGQAFCVGCQAGWFAPDPAQGACVRCNTTCEAGLYDAGVCPGAGPPFVLCLGCPGGLPGNASWSAANGSAPSCTYDCLDGFYHLDGATCRACTPRECEPGWRFTACTAGADSHCDQACVDADKPSVYSHWEKDCAWACDAGYELRVWDYGMFTLRECARI
jgi:hypothetical protein